MELDHIDFQILHILTKQGRVQWKDVGEQIHMTGQAVGNRIRKLEESGTIQAYSILVDEMKIGLSYTAFVIIYMKTANHDSFTRFITDQPEVVEAHRVSGEGCYHLTLKVHSQEKLNVFLTHILDYGNYSVYLSLKEVKREHLLHATVEKDDK